MTIEYALRILAAMFERLFCLVGGHDYHVEEKDGRPTGSLRCTHCDRTIEIW